jgi:dTDP-4-dehydrorhamnose 3,5-epimerase
VADYPGAMVKLPSAVKDEAHISPEWEVRRDLIAGVDLREVRHVVTRNGITTEVHRRDWGVSIGDVEQIIHVTLRPGALSAWHMHELKTDHLFVVSGMAKVVLFDGRVDSPTSGQIDELICSAMRPTLLVIPPMVWHGIHNTGSEPLSFVNYFDVAYDYAAPDDWRMPPDTVDVPYQF